MELLFLALKIVGVLLAVFIVLLLWCMCVVSSWSNKLDERDEELYKTKGGENNESY